MTAGQVVSGRASDRCALCGLQLLRRCTGSEAEQQHSERVRGRVYKGAGKHVVHTALQRSGAPYGNTNMHKACAIQSCDDSEVHSQQMPDVNSAPVLRCLPTVGWAPCTPEVMLKDCVSTTPRSWRGCKQALLFSGPCLTPA
jgi:hypothetical protein